MNELMSEIMNEYEGGWVDSLRREINELKTKRLQIQPALTCIGFNKLVKGMRKNPSQHNG